MAEGHVELVLSLDQDDPSLESYRYFYPRDHYNRMIIGDNKSAIDAINTAALFAKGDIFIVVSDDTDCMKGWDMAIMEETKGCDDWILKTNDGIQPWLITMPVMDRIYYNRFGYIYHPSYKHCFCDTELTCVAEMTGRLIHSNLKFPHKHYTVNGLPDELNKRNDATFEEGRRNFIKRKDAMFGLTYYQIKGRLSDNVYTRMK
jgi:hypothetical protein